MSESMREPILYVMNGLMILFELMIYCGGLCLNLAAALEHIGFEERIWR